MFRFDDQYLKTKLSGQWTGVSPYPHVVIDNFLPEHFLSKVLAEVPKPDQVTIRNNYDTQGKSAVHKNESVRIPDNTYNLISEMNSATFLTAVSRLTGIDGLIPDPYIHCGGIHQTRSKGFLGIHADYTYLGELRLERRLNMLLYLNPNWDEAWGGHLGMWDRNLTKCEKKIAPFANRLVIMECDATTWHGHPEPLNAPAGVTRNSIALYLYTSGRPRGQTRYRDLSTRYEIVGGRYHGLQAITTEVKHMYKNWRRLRKIDKNVT